MLTFEINDAQLEHRILEKARSIGKTAQELLKDLLTKAIQEDIALEKLPFEVPKLDYREHISIIDNKLTEEEELLANDSSVKVFSHIQDSAKYVHDLRRKPRN